jgi:hypothetical protein
LKPSWAEFERLIISIVPHSSFQKPAVIESRVYSIVKRIWHGW